MISRVFRVRLSMGLAALLLTVLSLLSCTREVSVLGGATMGTTYSITIPDLRTDDQVVLETRIVTALEEVNAAMSTYRDDSSITAFNASASRDWIDVPTHFAVVAEAAIEVAKASNGAFDPTIGPLVRRWGFGNDEKSDLPTAQEINRLLETVGYLKLQVDRQRSALRKLDDNLQIDLNAIAKGYAVDLIAEIVSSLGYQNFLVEIGGELRASGYNSAGEAWRIGIEMPAAGETKKGLHLDAGGVATSGDYRNAFEQNGVRYSHIIDPRSGRPVGHALASVTVVADTAMLADAWATALMVLGPVDGMKIADQHGLAGFFIVREGPESFATHGSVEFRKLELR